MSALFVIHHSPAAASEASFNLLWGEINILTIYFAFPLFLSAQALLTQNSHIFKLLMFVLCQNSKNRLLTRMAVSCSNQGQLCSSGRQSGLPGH